MTDYEQVLRFGEGDQEITVSLLPAPEELGLAGVAEGKVLPGMVPVRVDDTPEEERIYSIGALLRPRNCSGVISLIPDMFDRLKKQDALALLVVFHELGHCVHRRDKTDEESRKELVRKGEVDPAELEADAFAARYLGKDKVLAGLQMLRGYNAGHFPPGSYDEEDAALADRELVLRIERLEAWRNDDIKTCILTGQ